MILFPLVHLIIRRTGLHFQVFRLATLYIAYTALVISSVYESCTQLTELVSPDSGCCLAIRKTYRKMNGCVCHQTFDGVNSVATSVQDDRNVALSSLPINAELTFERHI